MSLKQCQRCGTALPEHAAFCFQCGYVIALGKPLEEGDSSTTLKFPSRSHGALKLEDIPAGSVIDGRYEVVRKLGQGGFGAVYLAKDRKMGVEKALKVIPEAIVHDGEAMEDLRHEARLMVVLDHPNIVRVFDLHDTGPIKFIDMQYVDGQNLASLKLGRPGRRFSEGEAGKYAFQVAEAMAYAHGKNILHRDIKPQNVMVGKDGTVKVMDFGIAETVRNSMTRLTGITSSGTLLYMSPEQLRGKGVGKESDIYSFGAMLYDLLSGHPPFWRGDIQYQLLHEMPERIEGLSSLMTEVLQRCLEKDYRSRFGSFVELTRRLLPVRDRPAGRSGKPMRGAGERKVVRGRNEGPAHGPREGTEDNSICLAESVRLEMADGSTCVLIPARTALPAKYEEDFVIGRSSDKYVEFHLLQGESDSLPGNRTLGRFRLAGINLNTWEEANIRLATTIDRKGSLSARVEDRDRRKAQSYPPTSVATSSRAARMKD